MSVNLEVALICLPNRRRCNPTYAGHYFERLFFEMAPTFQKTVFQKRVFCRGIALYPTCPPKARLHEGFPSNGAESGPPPNWDAAEGRFLYGGFRGYVGYTFLKVGIDEF